MTGQAPQDLPGATPPWRALPAGKFQQDVLWNLASLGFVAASGVAINFIIASCYGAAILGVFNQVYAAFIFFSQFATAGCHLSTLKHVAQYAEDRQTSRDLITAALAVTAVLAALVSAAFWLCAPWVAWLLDSPGVASGMFWATPGLFFLAINKVLLAVLNGQRHMKPFAAFQALRFALMIATLGALIVAASTVEVTICFSAAEVLLFVGLLPCLWRDLSLPRPDRLVSWAARHLDFGLRGFMSGVLAEINTRVDVLMLGYFCSDRVVGVYSFAAMLAEGAYQLPLVLKQNYNPLLVQVIRDRQWETLRGMTRKGRRFTYAAMFLVCGAGLAVFPLLARFARDGAAFMESWPVFALLIAGVFAASGYAPFGNILLQAHRPGLHTMMITAAVGLNALGNWALIPLWAAQGAALATAVSMAAWVLFLRAAARRALGVWI